MEIKWGKGCECWTFRQLKKNIWDVFFLFPPLKRIKYFNQAAFCLLHYLSICMEQLCLLIHKSAVSRRFIYKSKHHTSSCFKLISKRFYLLHKQYKIDDSLLNRRTEKTTYMTLSYSIMGTPPTYLTRTITKTSLTFKRCLKIAWGGHMSWHWKHLNNHLIL